MLKSIRVKNKFQTYSPSSTSIISVGSSALKSLRALMFFLIDNRSSNQWIPNVSRSLTPKHSRRKISLSMFRSSDKWLRALRSCKRSVSGVRNSAQRRKNKKTGGYSPAFPKQPDRWGDWAKSLIWGLWRGWRGTGQPSNDTFSVHHGKRHHSSTPQSSSPGLLARRARKTEMPCPCENKKNRNLNVLKFVFKLFLSALYLRHQDAKGECKSE